jgi:hypothetical protein
MYDRKSTIYGIPYPADGNYINETNEQDRTLVIENAIRTATVQDTNNRIFAEGNFLTTGGTTSTVSLTGTPSLRAIVENRFVEVSTDILWAGIPSGGLSYLYVYLGTNVVRDPTDITTAVSPTPITTPGYLLIATLDTTTPTTPKLNITPTGKLYANGAIQFVEDQDTIPTDAATGSTFAITLTGNRTLDKPLDPLPGQEITWRIRQDATGGRTLTLNAAFRFGTTIPNITLSTAPNKTDYLRARYNDIDDRWDVTDFKAGY